MLIASRVAALVVLALCLGLTISAEAGVYFNSAEPGCDGSDANVLHCDDFEHNASGGTPGTWYTLNGDQQPQNSASQKGWMGTIFADSYIPVATLCGNQGAAGTNCTANSGTLPGPNPDFTGNMAFHAFAPSVSGYNEVYFRRYVKYSANHTSGPQKYISWNNFVDIGISIGGYGAGAGPFAMCPVLDCNFDPVFNNPQNIAFPNGCPGGVSHYLCQNILPKFDFNAARGNWIFEEMRIKLNTNSATRDGIWQLWLNDCGTAGFCTGTPTLRSNFTNVKWVQSGPNLIFSYFMENQSNPAATGTELYDQIKVARVGPIGFMGAASGTNTNRSTVTGVTAFAAQQPSRVIGAVFRPNAAVRGVLAILSLLVLVVVLHSVKGRARR